VSEAKVKIRIRIGDYELQVEGHKKWAEKTIKEFIDRIKKQRAND